MMLFGIEIVFTDGSFAQTQVKSRINGTGDLIFGSIRGYTRFEFDRNSDFDFLVDGQAKSRIGRWISGYAKSKNKQYERVSIRRVNP